MEQVFRIDETVFKNHHKLVKFTSAFYSLLLMSNVDVWITLRANQNYLSIIIDNIWHVLILDFRNNKLANYKSDLALWVG